MSSSRSDPYDAFNFLVVIDGVPAAAFSECILPAISIEAIEYREGNDLQSNVHKLPGLVRYENLVLSRGLTLSTALWDWFNSFVQGTGTPKTLAVTLLDSRKVPVFKWSFSNAWPTKYTSPVLSGKESAIAIETLEVSVEGMAVSNLAQSA